MSKPRFIHLRLHSAYSLLEGALQVKKLPGLVAELGMPAVAITDTNNNFAALEFSTVAMGAGVQPIVGACMDLRYAEAARPGDRPPMPAPIVLLAQSEAGYANLMKLNSALYLSSGDELPHLTMAELSEHAAGLICLTGGAEGPVGKLLQDGQAPKAQELMKRLKEVFGDRLYVEIQRHPVADQRRTPAEAATEPGFVVRGHER